MQSNNSFSTSTTLVVSGVLTQTVGTSSSSECEADTVTVTVTVPSSESAQTVTTESMESAITLTVSETKSLTAVVTLTGPPQNATAIGTTTITTPLSTGTSSADAIWTTNSAPTGGYTPAPNGTYSVPPTASGPVTAGASSLGCQFLLGALAMAGAISALVL